MSVEKFTKQVEKQIDPIEVGTLHLMQKLIEPIPTPIQKQIIHNSSKDKPYMGFVVEPYSLFIAYKIKDLDYFREQLPTGFSLHKTKISNKSDEDYYFILGAFSARTSGFMGNRIEGYVIAKDEKTNLTSWVIVDYVTNTISYDPANVLIGSNVDEGFITTTFDGQILVDMNNSNYNLQVSVNTKGSMEVLLDEDLWVLGNLSVAYGRKFSREGHPFGLIFNKDEMQSANQVDVQSIAIKSNTWFSQYLEEEPSEVLYFQFAQHFISESPGSHNQLHDTMQLQTMHDKILETNINKYANSNFSKVIEISILINILLGLIIIATIIF